MRRAVQTRRERMIAGALGCMVCGRKELSVGLCVCPRCRRELAPTPLQRAVDALGLDEGHLAASCRLSAKTIQRAITGFPVGPRAAASISKRTGVDRDVLRRGSPPPDSLSLDRTVRAAARSRRNA